MIRILLSMLILILSVLAQPVAAQQGISIGIKAGYVLDKIGRHRPYSSIDEGYFYHTGLNNGKALGFQVQYAVSPSLSFGTGVTIIRRFISSFVVNTTSTFYASKHVFMLEVPVCIFYKAPIGEGGKSIFNAFTGPSVVLWENRRYGGSGYFLSNPATTYQKIENEVRQEGPCFGLKTGLGFERELNKYGSLYFGLTYNQIFSKPITLYGNYMSGNHKATTVNRFRGSYLMIDVIYYLPWRAFTGEKRKEPGAISGVPIKTKGV